MNIKSLLEKMSELSEERKSSVKYEETADKIIASLRSHDSASYTKLAQKISRISELNEEITKLKDEVKKSTKEDVADLFDATDDAKTRVVETLQFVFTLSKTPKETETPKYKDILDQLTKHLTPELIAVLDTLKKTLVTKTQKEPSLRVSPHDPTRLDESKMGSFFKKLKHTIAKWGDSYDRRLDKLKDQIATD